MRLMILLFLILIPLMGQSEPKSATPEELTRRLYLDLMGRTPTIEEYYESVELIESGKVSGLVDKLLKTDAYKDNLAYQIVKHFAPKNERRSNLANRLRLEEHVRKNYIDENNRDFRVFIDDLFNARGLSSFNEMVLFYGEKENAADITGRLASRTFGVPMNCARCHDHKDYTDIKQKDFWALAGFFDNMQKRQLRQKRHLDYLKRFEKRGEMEDFLGKDQAKSLRYWIEKEEAGESIYANSEGGQEGMSSMMSMQERKSRKKKKSKAKKDAENAKVKNAKKPENLLVPQLIIAENNNKAAHKKAVEYEYQGKKFTTPLSLPFRKGGISSNKMPRASLSKWITSSSNPYFAPAVANWVGQWLLGKPIVEPVSDVYSSVARKDKKLKWAASRFKSGGYNINKLIKAIVLSPYYSLENSSINNEEAFVNFTARRFRYLSAEQLFNSIYKDTERLYGTRSKSMTMKRKLQYERKKEATQQRYFPEDIDQYELSYRGSMLQALYISQDKQMANYVDLIAKKGYRERRKKAIIDFVQELVLRLYSRQPTDDELLFFLSQIDLNKPYEESGYYQVVWTLINSPEMRIY